MGTESIFVRVAAIVIGIGTLFILRTMVAELELEEYNMAIVNKEVSKLEMRKEYEIKKEIIEQILQEEEIEEAFSKGVINLEVYEEETLKIQTRIKTLYWVLGKNKKE